MRCACSNSSGAAGGSRGRPLDYGTCAALLALESEEEQLHLREQILATGLSVGDRSADLLRNAPLDGRSKPAHFIVIEETLQRHLGTRVAIRPGRKHGKIEITYTGEDDLQLAGAAAPA